MKFLCNFSVLYYISYIVLSRFTICCVANRVQTMHDLLSCSGWLGMASLYQQMEIIDRRHPHQPESKWTVLRLLATPVTEANVTDKIQVAHQFLSCSYARVLIDLCDYEQVIGPQCRREEIGSESFVFLEDYLQVIQYKSHVVSRMTGALASLQNLAPSQTHFEKGVFKILGELEKYYQRKAVVRPADEDDQTTKRIADAESEAIEQHSRLMKHRLFAFYNRYCYPIDYWIRDSGLSKPTDDINQFADDSGNDNFHNLRMIKKKITFIVKEFMESHDANSGFDYDPESNTTRIMRYDPNVDELVEKMNQLLENHNFWHSLSPLEIKELGRPYRTTVDDLLNPTDRLDEDIVVTKENLNVKLKRAHQFLSCQNARIILECGQDVEDMWTNCKRSNGSVCLESFLQILKVVEPSVLRMIDSLWYFYQLSPDTVFNKDVLDLLNRFKNIYDDRTDVMSLSPEIEREISEISQNSTAFFEQFCYSESDIHPDYVSTRGKKGTINAKGKMFKKNMLKLTYYYDIFK